MFFTVRFRPDSQKTIPFKKLSPFETVFCRSKCFCSFEMFLRSFGARLAKKHFRSKNSFVCFLRLKPYSTVLKAFSSFPMYFLCISFIFSSYFGYISFPFPMYFLCTSFVCPSYFLHISFIFPFYFLCISCVFPLYFLHVSFVFPLYFLCNSFVFP